MVMAAHIAALNLEAEMLILCARIGFSPKGKIPAIRVQPRAPWPQGIRKNETGLRLSLRSLDYRPEIQHLFAAAVV